MRSSHTGAETKDQQKGGFLLDVVVTQRPAIFELHVIEDEPLLMGRDALLVPDFLLDIADRAGRLKIERDGLSREGLNEDLHATAKVKGRFPHNAVVTQRLAILELLVREEENLLIERDALPVPDLLLDIADGVGRLDVERDGLSREGLDKDWNCKQHTTNWGGAKNER